MNQLTGRKLYIPRMSDEGAELTAAAFRSQGVEAQPSPQSDESTLELAAKFTTGEECLPQRVTLGNFLKIILADDFIPEKNAFLMPTSNGPCRFGQYSPLLKTIIKELGYEEAVVFSPTSSNGYEDFAGKVNWFLRTAWRSIVAADITRKMLYMVRPYEKEEGAADKIHRKTLNNMAEVLSNPEYTLRKQMTEMQGVLENARDSYLKMPVKQNLGTLPLVGIVGEIYLRFNDFSNQYLIRKLEKIGAEAWIADISEWVWYTNFEEKRKLIEKGNRFSFQMAKIKIRHTVQKIDEYGLKEPVKKFFSDRREAKTEEILLNSEGFLPARMALGEMTLNSGKAISFYKEGCDGVVDISPFTCMNGIVTEVVYPNISRFCSSMPVRIFYFDGVPFDLEGDLEIFMEQVKTYRKKKIVKK